MKLAFSRRSATLVGLAAVLVTGGYTLQSRAQTKSQASKTGALSTFELSLAPEQPSFSFEMREGPAPSTSDEARVLFEAVAGRLRFFALSTVLYNRARLDFKTVDSKSYFVEMSRVLDARIPVESVTPLLHHPEAKVRTLALAALFHREDPQLLPLIAGLLGDKVPTLPSYADLEPFFSQHVGYLPKQEQSVSDVACAMLSAYLQPAGYFLTQQGTTPNAIFNAYWARHKDLKFCATWFMVQLARASEGTEPSPPETKARVARLRQRIDALPPADRDWTLLYLNGEPGSLLLASEADLLAAAKRRGPDALLRVLQEKIPSHDPDIQRRDSNDWFYERLMLWILGRAPQLLRPEMADDLLACEHYQRDYLRRNVSNPVIRAAWPVAAAQLVATQGDIKRARSIVRTAWTRFNQKYDGDNRLDLAVELARLGDPTDYSFVAAWYFAPPPARYDGVDSLGKEAGFFRNLPRKGASPTLRRLVARLVQDPRFNKTPFWGVYGAIELVNDWSGAKVLSSENLYDKAWRGDSNRPAAQMALAQARTALRRSSMWWGK